MKENTELDYNSKEGTDSYIIYRYLIKIVTYICFPLHRSNEFYGAWKMTIFLTGKNKKTYLTCIFPGLHFNNLLNMQFAS